MILNNFISHRKRTSLFIAKNDSLNKVLGRFDLNKFPIIRMQQVHNHNLYEVCKNQSKTINNVDAIITTQKNILLIVKTADCLPVLISYQDNLNNKNLIAVVHAGRKGTNKNILKKVLVYIKNKYTPNLKTGNFIIWLGPAICKKCYQINKKTNLYYDLYQRNKDQIKQTIKKYNVKIITSEYCTFHDNQYFYSYRKTGKGVKMNYGVIGMI